MLAVRIGQQRFPKPVLAIWHSKARHGFHPVSDCRTYQTSWAESSDAERIDPYNGLSSYRRFMTRVFDSGYISFEDDGRILISWFRCCERPIT